MVFVVELWVTRLKHPHARVRVRKYTFFFPDGSVPPNILVPIFQFRHADNIVIWPRIIDC